MGRALNLAVKTQVQFLALAVASSFLLTLILKGSRDGLSHWDLRGHV